MRRIAPDPNKRTYVDPREREPEEAGLIFDRLERYLKSTHEQRIDFSRLYEAVNTLPLTKIYELCSLYPESNKYICYDERFWQSRWQLEYSKFDPELKYTKYKDEYVAAQRVLEGKTSLGNKIAYAISHGLEIWLTTALRDVTNFAAINSKVIEDLVLYARPDILDMYIKRSKISPEVLGREVQRQLRQFENVPLRNIQIIQDYAGIQVLDPAYIQAQIAAGKTSMSFDDLKEVVNFKEIIKKGDVARYTTLRDQVDITDYLLILRMHSLPFLQSTVIQEYAKKMGDGDPDEFFNALFYELPSSRLPTTPYPDYVTAYYLTQAFSQQICDMYLDELFSHVKNEDNNPKLFWDLDIMYRYLAPRLKLDNIKTFVRRIVSLTTDYTLAPPPVEYDPTYKQYHESDEQAGYHCIKMVYDVLTTGDPGYQRFVAATLASILDEALIYVKYNFDYQTRQSSTVYERRQLQPLNFILAPIRYILYVLNAYYRQAIPEHKLPSSWEDEYTANNDVENMERIDEYSVEDAEDTSYFSYADGLLKSKQVYIAVLLGGADYFVLPPNTEYQIRTVGVSNMRVSSYGVSEWAPELVKYVAPLLRQ